MGFGGRHEGLELMASEGEQGTLRCSRCGGIEWRRGTQMIFGEPARKSDGWDEGPAEWTCN